MTTGLSGDVGQSTPRDHAAGDRRAGEQRRANWDQHSRRRPRRAAVIADSDVFNALPSVSRDDTHSSCRFRSRAVCQRSSGSFARQRATISSSIGGDTG